MCVSNQLLCITYSADGRSCTMHSACNGPLLKCYFVCLCRTGRPIFELAERRHRHVIMFTAYSMRWWFYVPGLLCESSQLSRSHQPPAAMEKYAFLSMPIGLVPFVYELINRPSALERNEKNRLSSIRSAPHRSASLQRQTLTKFNSFVNSHFSFGLAMTSGT